MSKRQHEVGTDEQVEAISSGRSQVERRRSALPQPDFTYYKKANAYPGKQYLFVGHSYNVESGHAEPGHEAKRKEAIVNLFDKNAQWVPVKTALTNDTFDLVLSRFERDFLARLPETAVISPAIDLQGDTLEQCFTVWRKEMRRQPSNKS